MAESSLTLGSARRAALLLSCALAACSGASKSASDGAPPVVDATPALRDGGRGDRDAVFASFGTIDTIAGTGQLEDKGVSGWQPSFEGGPATVAELSRPHIALADDSGVLYVADKDAHGIRRIALDGSIATFAGTNAAGDDGDGPGPATEMRLSSPNGLWVADTGVVYVLDLGNDQVRRVQDGNMSTLFTIGGAGTGRGLWVADDESLAYVSAGSELKKWTPGGGVQVLASGFASLGNIFVEASGDLLVTDRLAHRVFRVGPAGDKTPIAGNGQRSGGGDGQRATDTGLDQVRGVWGHPEGGFFVATHKGGQVWYVDGAGHIHLFVDGDSDDSHEGDGLDFDDPAVRISEPRAVTMDAQGNLLIVEHDGGYIRRVNRR